MGHDHAHGASDTTGGMLTELDHVGIAVSDLDATVAWYEQMFGASVVHRERIESDGVDEALIKVAESYIQILTPFTDDSPLAKYMAKNGEGIHHIGYRVDDCDKVLEHVKGEGARVVDEHPRTGSRGTTVAFLHPKTANGCLIELVEE